MESRKKISTVNDPTELLRQLESLSEKIISAWDGTLGADSLAFLRQWCSPDYYMDWADSYELRSTETLDDHFQQVTELKRANPAWVLNAYNFTAVLDREQTGAMVMFTSGPSGAPGNPGQWSMNRESVSKLRWRRRESDGVWECFGHEVIRGGGLAVPM